jgi:Flp pilus assembly protein CpaB
VARTRRRPRRPPRPPLYYWAVAATAAALAGVVVGGLTRRALVSERAWGARANVVIATTDLVAGAVVRDGDTDVRSIPASLVPAGALDVSPLGRVVVTPVFRGEIVVDRRLGRDGASAVAALLPADTLGVAVPTGPAAVPLTVGDRVDVLAAAEGGAAHRVAQAAIVIAVGDEAVTVAVRETDAGAVASAVAAGTAVLALVPVSASSSPPG